MSSYTRTRVFNLVENKIFSELVVVVADVVNAQVERSTTAVERAGFGQETAKKNPGLRQKKNNWQVLKSELLHNESGSFGNESCWSFFIWT